MVPQNFIFALYDFLAVFYPDGKPPISGTYTTAADGKVTFTAYDTTAFPPGSAVQPGVLKMSSATGETEQRGTMNPSGTPGTGIFTPDQHDGELGMDA